MIFLLLLMAVSTKPILTPLKKTTTFPCILSSLHRTLLAEYTLHLTPLNNQQPQYNIVSQKPNRGPHNRMEPASRVYKSSPHWSDNSTRAKPKIHPAHGRVNLLGLDRVNEQNHPDAPDGRGGKALQEAAGYEKGYVPGCPN